MNTFLWLSFFFASPPSPSHALHPSDCSTRGTPLLEIRERSETSDKLTTKRIYASGGWTFKNEAQTARGCFDRKELRSIRRAVQRAPWQVTKSPIACFAYDPNFTEFVVNGRLRYTHRMCSGRTADTETLAAIDLIQQELAEEMPPLPLPPPVVRPEPRPIPPPVVQPMPPVQPTPPVQPPPVATQCRAEGTPLFEIKKRSEGTRAMSSTKIYANGAWTFRLTEVDGRPGALTTGCFNRASLSAIRTAVTRSPWDVTFNRIVCKAYSPSFTEYYVNGRYEYTARLCGEQRIDDASAAAIKTIETELAAVLSPADPEAL
jgi:hypothetical protein